MSDRQRVKTAVTRWLGHARRCVPLAILCVLAWPAATAGEPEPRPPRLWDPVAQMCFPDVVNTPDTWLQPPQIDGAITSDRGWTSAWRHVWMNGTIDNDVVVQAIKNGSHLFFSFEVKRLSSFSASDFLQVVIDPGTGTLHRYQLFPTNGAGSPTPLTLQYSTKAGAGAWAPSGVGGATVGVQAVAGPTNGWRVEMRIPRGAPVNVPGTFGLYLNTTLTYSPTATEYVWPNREALWLQGDPDNTPPSASFSQATLTGAPCNGVYIRPSDITTNNTPTSLINLTGPNTFRAVAHNAMTDTLGAIVAAPGVRATFRIANFGLSSAWANVPWSGALPNPTARATIPAGGTHTFEMTWTLTPAQQALYNTDTTRHQCILVELDADSAPGTVVFAQRSAWTNMNFGTASTFRHRAVVDARGFGRMAAPGARQRFDLVVRQLAGRELERAYPEAREMLSERQIMTMMKGQEGGESGNQPRVVTRYLQLVHGCIRTGRYIRINGTNFEICGRAGSYGYLVAHVGAVEASFRQSMQAATRQGALRADDRRSDVLQLEVPTDGTVDLETVIDATTGAAPPRRCPPVQTSSSLTVIGGLVLLGAAGARRRRRDDDMET